MSIPAISTLVALAVSAGCSSPHFSPSGDESNSTVNTDNIAKEYGPLRVVVQGGHDWVTAETVMEHRRIKFLDDCLTQKGYQASGETVNPERIRRDGLYYAYKTDIADDKIRNLEGYRATSYLVGIVSGDEETLHGTNTPPEILNECANTTLDQVVSPTVRDFYRKGWATNKMILEAPEFTEAQKQWSACMSKAGYDYDKPSDPPNILGKKARELDEAGPQEQRETQAATLHNEELRIAQSDWECREKTITPVLQQLRNEFESDFLSNNADLAERVKSEVQEIIANG